MKNYKLSTENITVTLLSLGSLTLLLLAIGIGIILDLQACKLCLYARWPHFLAFLIFPLYQIYEFIIYKVILVIAGTLTMVASFLISGYHSGVELKIWEGPTDCSASSTNHNLSVDELLDQILSTPVTRCDEVSWNFLYLSMANWNTAISLVFLFFWLRILNNLLFQKGFNF